MGIAGDDATEAFKRLDDRINQLEKDKTTDIFKHTFNYLIYHDFKHLVSMTFIIGSFVLIAAAMIAMIFWSSAAEPSKTVLNIMQAIIMAIVGFYFGSRGTEMAQEQTKEAQAKTHETEKELEQVKDHMEELENEKLEAQKVAKALDHYLEASRMHYAEKWDGSMTQFDFALDLAEKSPYVKARIMTDYAFLLLDPSLRIANRYEKLDTISDKALKLLRDEKDKDPARDSWLNYAILVRAIVLSNLADTPKRRKEAKELLGEVKDIFDEYEYLFKEGNLKREHFTRILDYQGQEIGGIVDKIRRWLETYENQGRNRN